MFLNRLFHKSSYKIMIFIMVGLLVISMSACGKKNDDSPKSTQTPAPSDVNELILTYKENGKITSGQFTAFINVNKLFNPQMAQYFDNPTYQAEMLMQYAANLILADKAPAEVKANADKQVVEQMKQIMDYFSQIEGGADKQLADNKIKKEDIENALRTSFYSMMSLQEKITNQQVTDEYNRKLAAKEYDTATISHILVALKDSATNKDIRTDAEALTRAKEVLAKLKAGEDFAKLAKEYSDDPGSKDNGGTYKDAAINQWVEPFKKAAMELPLNTLSDPPVKTDFGYHVMKVESRGAKKLEEVKEEIQSDLTNKLFGDFIKNELPGYILTNKLATPTPSPTATPAPKK